MDYYKEFTKQKILLKEADTNPEVSVDGLGTYDLRSLKSSTRNALINLASSLESDDPRVWRNAKHDMDSGVLQAKIDAIVATHEAMEAKRRRGGRPRTK